MVDFIYSASFSTAVKLRNIPKVPSATVEGLLSGERHAKFSST